MIRNIAVAAACLLLLASCQSGTEDSAEETALGRYMEESMPLPRMQSIVAFDEVSPDEYYLAGYDSDWDLQIWRSPDGCESWEEWVPDWLEAARGIHVQCASFSGDGVCYLAEVNRKEDGAFESTIYRAGPDGLRPLEVGQVETVRALAAGSSGQLLLADGEELVHLDPAAGTETRYPVGEGIGYYRLASHYAVTGNLAVVLEEDNQFVVIDLETGSEAIRFPCQVSGARAIAAAPDRSAVLYCHPSGVYRQTLDGVLTEKIIDGRLASFSMPNLRMERIHMRGDGAFLILCEKDEGGYDLQKYQFDPTAPTAPSTQLAIYATRDNANVRQAAAVFMRTHPDVLVDVQIGISDGEAAALEDAVRTLNTRLLAGAGPDILILDDLPMQSYIEKNVLADLSDGMTPLLASGELYEAVAGACRQNGSLYAVPGSFQVPVLAGINVENIQGMTDIAAYLDAAEQPLVYIPEDSMDWFYDKLAHRWFDADGTFLIHAFAEDLPAISQYAGYSSNQTRQAPYDLYNQSVWYSGGGLTILFGNLSSVDDASVVLSAMRERGGEVVSLGGGFVPSCIYGVNAAGAQVELAVEYVMAALDEQAQSAGIYSGIPVNRRAVLSLVDRKEAGTRTALLVHDNDVTQEQYTLGVTWFREADLDYFLSLLDSVDQPAPNNAVIRQIVLDETRSYFLGSEPLDDAISNLERKLNQYYMEQ